jgi:hypothetical protein
MISFMGGEGSRTELNDSTPLELEKFPAAAREWKNIRNYFSAPHLQFHGQNFPISLFFYELRVKVLNSSVEIRVEMTARRTRSLVIPHVSPVCTIVVHRSRKILSNGSL